MGKRIACLILALIFLGAFAACGGSGSKTQDEATTQDATTQAATTQASTEKETLEPAELTIAFMTVATAKDMDLVMGEISKYAKEKINATVKALPINVSAYGQQIRLMLASQEKLDLMATGTIGAGTVFDYPGQLANGQLYPLNDLLDKYGQGIKDALGDFINVAKSNGKIYAVVTNRDLASGAGFAIRTDLVEKHNIDLSNVKVHENYEDMLDAVEAVLKTLKEKEPKMIPFHYSQSASGTIVDMMSMYGGDSLGDDYLGVMMDANDSSLKVEDLFKTPFYESLLKRARKWYQAGYLTPDVTTFKDEAMPLVKNDKLASYIQNVKPGIKGQIDRQTAKDMTVIGITPVVATSSVGARFMWAIPNYCKVPERAMMFLNMMYDDPNLVNYFCWGIEGKHYAKQADGTIDYPEGVNAANTGFGLNFGFEFGNQLLSYVWKGDPVDLWKQMDEFNKTSMKSKALGFLFDPTPVKTEYAAVKNVTDQYRRALETGAMDPAKLPEFQSKLKAAGIDTIIAEKQKQLDAWAKANGVK